MAWETLTTADVLSEFTPNEAAALRNLQGSGSGSGPPFTNIDVIVARSIDEVRGYIQGGGYEVDQIDETTLPKALFADTIAIARWRVLIAVPQLKQLQTEERKKAFDDAIAKLNLIVNQQFSIEPPIPDTGIQTGLWNSENKLIMRTHPVPKPAAQFGPQGADDYANPDAPPDAAPAP